MTALLDLRLALQANGYSPIPCQGKRPMLLGWQRMPQASADEMARWAGPNTGLLTANLATFDLDIPAEEIAEAAETIIKEWFDGRGKILVRFGAAPKRAIPFRTETPFPKMQATLADAHGRSYKIEILGEGQQFIAFGQHPDIGKSYAWAGGYDPANTPRTELPEINESEATELLAFIVESLCMQFTLTHAEPPKRNGAAPQAGTSDTRVDVDASLAAMTYEGAGDTSINNTLKRVIPSLLWHGTHPSEVLDTCVKASMAAGERAGQQFDYREEVRRVSRSIVSTFRWLCSTYDPDTQIIPPWVPGEWHTRWMAYIAEGIVPRLEYHHLRGFIFRRRSATPLGNAPSAEKLATSDPTARQPPKRLFSLKSFEPIDPATLPPREWVYGKHYQRRTVSATIAPGGTGKSSLCLVEVVAMTTVRALLGEQPTSRLKVWYHNGEDDHDEINRRIVAICQHFGVPQEELQGHLHITTADDVPLRVAKGYNDLKIDADVVGSIEGEIGDNAIDVAVFDPFVTLHGINESDNSRMDAVVRLFAGIAHEYDCAIELAHHTRKVSVGIGEYTIDDIRGASAIRDAIRSARVLNHMSAYDAQRVAVPEEDRSKYFRVDKVKGNNAPALKAVWRRFVSIDLANGDDVGVVEAWACPGQGELTDAMLAAERTAEGVFIALLVRFTIEDRECNDLRGSRYAPTLFCVEREAKDAGVGKPALEGAMRRLLAAKRIKVEAVARRGRATNILMVA